MNRSLNRVCFYLLKGEMIMSLVFTYGTLIRGQAAYGTRGKMEYLGDGVLRDYGIYEVIENGARYPAAVPVKGFCVYGELFEVNDETLQGLDEYEGEGDLYIRRLMEIEVGPKVFNAWFYEYNRDVSRLELRAPVGKWNPERKPLSDYAWYVCYGSNLLQERFDDYLERINGQAYAQKPYMLNGEIYFAKKSGKWDSKGICFIDLNENGHRSYCWAYLVEKNRIHDIKEKEGKLYLEEFLGFDEYGIPAYTVTGKYRDDPREACIDYLTVIAAGLSQRFGLSQNEIRKYLNCNEVFNLDAKNIEGIIVRHCKKQK